MAHLEHYNTTDDIKDAEKQYAVLLTRACFLNVIRVDTSYRQVVDLLQHLAMRTTVAIQGHLGALNNPDKD